jgi:hypothetical protein
MVNIMSIPNGKLWLVLIAKAMQALGILLSDAGKGFN